MKISSILAIGGATADFCNDNNQQVKNSGIKTKKNVFNTFYPLTLTGKLTNKLLTWIWLKKAERSEAEVSKRSFASEYLLFLLLTRRFASRF